MADNLPRAYDPRGNAVRSLEALAMWQAGTAEPPLDPRLPIIDAHHHLRRRADQTYLPHDLIVDAGGHQVVATVVVEYGSGHRETGPEALRPVGETEFILAELPRAMPGLGAAIVGRADLRLGADVRPVLEAHIAAGRGRFRGVRHPLRWDPAGVGMFGEPDPRGLALDPTFRKGFAQLAPLGLSFDVWAFHHQLGEVAALARAFPDTTMIINHVGGPLGVGPYAGRRSEVMAILRDGLRLLADCPNVVVKVGGLGMLYFGFDFHEGAKPPSSETLAAAWRPYFEICIALFGACRCMFESNFPVDKQSCSYGTLVNAFKRLAAGLSTPDRRAFFAGTAARVYRVPEPLP